MIAAICSWLRHRSSRDPSLALRVKLEAEQAYERAREAETRGDTRDYGRALMILRASRHEQLRRELGLLS